MTKKNKNKKKKKSSSSHGLQKVTVKRFQGISHLTISADLHWILPGARGLLILHEESLNWKKSVSMI